MHRNTWHVYLNPECPEICAHLAFARLLMYNLTILNGQTKLFEGCSQYDRSNKIFRDIVSHPDHREEFAKLGMTPADFGTHSIRKGAATHISTGSTACPPIASICLRANWAMPGVLNKYIKYESASDQFVGKCASGRSRNSKKFGASCAYWDFSGLLLDERDTREAGLKNFLRGSLPVQARDNLRIYPVYKMAVAALVFYRDHLEEHLHPNSALRACSLWNETIPSAELVVVKYPWDATDDTPEITGLPPDIMLLAEIESLKRNMADLKADSSQASRRRWSASSTSARSAAPLLPRATRSSKSWRRCSTRSPRFRARHKRYQRQSHFRHLRAFQPPRSGMPKGLCRTRRKMSS